MTHLIPGTYGPDDLLPGGAKIRGLNVTRNKAQNATTPFNADSYMWRDWDPVGLQAQLDDAVEFGCNVVRIGHGSFTVVYSGAITEATYISRWMTLMGWAEARGLYVYPTLQNGNGNDNFTGVPYATYEGYATRLVAELGPTQRCIGIDVVQEARPFAISTSGSNLINAVRGVTDLPCTYSLISQESPLGGGGTQTASNVAIPTLLPIVDFFDLHWYWTPPSASVFEDYWWNFGIRSGYRVLLGEFGGKESEGGSVLEARFARIADSMAYVGASGHRPAGAITWCARDFDTPITNQHGLSLADGTRRCYRVEPFQTIPTA